ncbi:MAG: thioredoxin family protein, partial [Bacteroidetes bacterium]
MRIRQTASPRQQISRRILYGMATAAALALALIAWFRPSSTEQSAAELAFSSGNFDYALAQALSEDKLCLVKFGTAYCYPCERLDELIFSDPALKSLLRERFIPFRVDPWDPQLGGSELAQRYDVESYPTLLVTDSEGNELWRIQGAPDAARLSDLLS